MPGSAARLTREQWLEQLNSDERGCALWEPFGQLRPARRLALVRNIAQAQDTRARKLLAAALWDEKPEVSRAAIAGLLALGHRDAVDSLDSLASISRAAGVVEAARDAAAALRALPVDTTDAPIPAEPEYWASFIDGDGSQLLMAVRPAADGDRRLATVALSDRRGVVDSWGSDTVREADAAAIRAATGRRSGAARAGRRPEAERIPEIGWVRVDGAYCGAAIAAALAIHRRDHRRLPGAWEFWKDSFETPPGEASLELDTRAFLAGPLRRRLSQTASLIHFEGFRSWLILGEDVAPFLPAARQAVLSDAEDREGQISLVVSACLAAVVRKPQRRIWRARLLRQAELWRRRGDPVMPELCAAAAQGLDDREGVPSEEHPLLRAMTRSSLEIALGG